MTRAGAGKRLMSPRHCNDTPNRNTRWAGDLQPRPTSKCVSHCTECVKHTHTHTHTHASLPPTHSTWLRNMHPHTLSTHTYHHPTLGSGVPSMAVNTRTHSDHSHIHTHTYTHNHAIRTARALWYEHNHAWVHVSVCSRIPRARPSFRSPWRSLVGARPIDEGKQPRCESGQPL
jgi:hypothetical protein